MLGQVCEPLLPVLGPGLALGACRAIEHGARASLLYVPDLFRVDVTRNSDSVKVEARGLAGCPFQHVYGIARTGDANDPGGFRAHGLDPVELWMAFVLPDPIVAMAVLGILTLDDLRAAHVVARGEVWPARLAHRGNGPWEFGPEVPLLP